jgi:hypothetical protein
MEEIMSPKSFIVMIKYAESSETGIEWDDFVEYAAIMRR